MLRLARGSENQSAATGGIRHHGDMKSEKFPFGTPTCILYFTVCGVAFLAGGLGLASSASMAGRYGYPWWPVVLLGVLGVVTGAVALVVGVVRCRQGRQKTGTPPVE